ncbi:MAG TPA: Gfo/Idh/MocA family oxidoreductase [Flavobacteriaceae bacterium]|nr:Gfo/Idh/MocA family oxidoreductase [Flavobacteriaceae bacterium]
MIKIGVIGAGHLGKIHLKLLNSSNKYDLIGFYDTDIKTSKHLSKKEGYNYFSNLETLLDNVEAVDIVSPTSTHHEIAKNVILKNKHVFIEKPLTDKTIHAKELIELSKKYNVVGQVGHVERFNPAYVAAINHIDNPMFIESHRLSDFNPRGNDVSVIMDLMIHDIDIVLNTVKSKVKQINASGVSIVSDSPDIANARIEFENKCVANLTASRISLKKMRKTRIFQNDAYISIDFLEKELQIVKIKDADKSSSNLSMVIKTNSGKDKVIYFENPEILEENSILNELESFAESINNKTITKVTLLDGYEAVAVANEIMDQIQ